MASEALAGAGSGGSSGSGTARRASRTVPHAKPKGAASRASVGVLASDGAGVWHAATGEPVGTPIFVPQPAQSPVRVTKKEPDIYDIEVVPRGLCATASPPRGSDAKRKQMQAPDQRELPHPARARA